MFCPQCACEFREGFTRCSDCDVDLVPALPMTGESPDSALVRIVETDDVALIAALKSVFEDAEIEFETRNEGLQDLIGGGRLAGFNPVLGRVELWVREENESAARELVRQTEESAEESSTELPDPGDAPQGGLPMRYARPFRRAIAAGVLNVIVPLSAWS